MQLAHKPVTEHVISQQGSHKSKFCVHPALLKPRGLSQQQADGHRDSHSHTGRGDDVGETFLHQGVLIPERLLQFRRQLLGFDVVDEQAHEIKETRKPHHNPNDVQGLEPEIGLGRERHQHSRSEATLRRVQVSPSRKSLARR